MAAASALSLLRSWIRPLSRSGAPKDLRTRRARPVMEALEDRVVPVTIPTTTFVDEDNGFLGGGFGVSLREAVRYSATNDTIQLSAGTYQLTLFGAGENLGATGDLDITPGKILTISGPASCNAIIDGQYADRVFDIHSTATLNLSNVEITAGNAYADPNPFDRQGGGIRNRNGFLNMTVCNRINNSYATHGGGIGNLNSANLQMSNTLLQYNFGEMGGGLFNAFLSSGTISASQIDTNWANEGAGIFSGGNASLTIQGLSDVSNNVAFFNGGGIYNEASTLRFLQSSIIANISFSDGAGIYGIAGIVNMSQGSVYYNYALTSGGGLSLNNQSATILNSTISSNYATNDGGGILLGFNAGLTLIHDTVTLNVANAGSGIHVGPAPSPLLNRSLVAENYNWSSALDDVSGLLNPTGVQNVLSSGLYGLPVATNVITPIGFIAPLGTCTGAIATLAHNLLPGNLAINRPAAPVFLFVDQKGKPRGTLPDSGACETSPLGPTPGGPQDPALDVNRIGEDPAAPLGMTPVRQVTNLAVANLATVSNSGALSITPTANAVDGLASLLARANPSDHAARWATDFVLQLGIE